MRRGLAIATLLASAARCIAGGPLPMLARAPSDPDRMWSISATGVADLPPYFAQGWETGLTAVAWVRYATPHGAGLLCFPSHSTVPARATREGGDELPAFLDLASVPFDAGATWGASGVVPQDAAEVPGRTGRFVVCINCATDTALTITIGGAEISVPATNDFIRNVEVSKGDTSVAVSAAAAGAQTSLALAVNPWIEFIHGAEYAPVADGNQMSASLITNCWAMLCWRARLDGGVLAETFDLVCRDGASVSTSSSSSYLSPALVRNSRFRYSIGSLSGMSRRLDVYGVKHFPGWIDDAAVWRVWELDLAEIRRRGLDTALH